MRKRSLTSLRKAVSKLGYSPHFPVGGREGKGKRTGSVCWYQRVRESYSGKKRERWLAGRRKREGVARANLKR